jgi:AraC family transcriptional regulator
MPYHRHTVAQTASVIAERVVLLELSERWGPEYEVNAFKFVVPLSGYVYVRSRAGEDLIDSATALTMSPQTRYQMRQSVPQTSVVLTVHDATTANEFSIDRPLAACRSIDLSTIRALHRLAVFSNDQLATEEGLVGAVSALASQHGAARDVRTRSSSARRALMRAREFLAARYRENFSLSDVARNSHVSPFHLARMFREQYGAPLFAFRERLRMAEAMNRLNAKRSDLSALALDLGYSSHSHFTAAFTRAIGCTPSQWAAR